MAWHHNVCFDTLFLRGFSRNCIILADCHFEIGRALVVRHRLRLNRSLAIGMLVPDNEGDSQSCKAWATISAADAVAFDVKTIKGPS